MKKKKSRFSIIYGLLLTGFTAFVILEAFVFPQTYAVMDAEDMKTDQTAETQQGSSEITLKTCRENGTSIYVADVQLNDASALRTAFAEDIYGKNITATTSQIASAHNAKLAVNGDYYSARDGYVIRNGKLYRSESSDPDQEDLVIYSDGDMEIIRDGDVGAEELLSDGAVQVLCFGPGLVEDGQVTVSEDEEVSKSMGSNPRTAIGRISDTHYVMVVSDGRTSESEGLSLRELAEFMESLGCETAYNLDGGGSSAMYYQGNIVNKPTANGSRIEERKVSDIVYISE